MQSNFEKEMLRTTLQDWSHSGFGQPKKFFNSTNRSVNDIFEGIKTEVKGKKKK